MWIRIRDLSFIICDMSVKIITSPFEEGQGDVKITKFEKT
jgi:hypothetical protein